MKALAKQLERTGRTSWVAEEIKALQDPALYRLDPEQAWRRLKPRTSNKRFLAILAALAEWREREAQARDLPRNRVIKDEALMEIAAHPPETAAALEHIRAVPKGFATSRLAKGLLRGAGKRSGGPTARRDRAGTTAAQARALSLVDRSAEDAAALAGGRGQRRASADRQRRRHRTHRGTRG